ncbi:dipeptide epimerase [bacterium]|nr:dipeptide epimerase [bacterium]
MISGWNLYQTRVKCKRPFAIATGTQDECSALLVELKTADGLSGWGEGVPLPYLTGETLTGCQAVLEQLFLPALLGEDPRGLEGLRRKLNRLAVNQPAARCALDLALIDLSSRLHNMPCWALLGGSNQPVATNYSIGLTSPEDAAQQARSLVEQDFTCIKLKIGQDPDFDLDRCRAVRGAIGPEIGLRVDANEGWTFLQAKRFLSRAESLDLQLIEQPLVRSDFEGLKRLRAFSSTPICADESLRGVQEARRLAEMQAVDVFNIKLMKCGGILEARDIVAIARAHGIDLMIGGMVGESSIAVAAATAVASTWNFEYADLDADLLLRANFSDGGALHQPVGYRYLSEQPGWPVGQMHAESITLLASC